MTTPTPRADEPTTGDVVRVAVANTALRLARHASDALDHDDAEDLHQSRVAARRLRSDLRTFAPLLSDDWTGRLRRELSWLGGVLGAVRDGDVLRARLEHELRTLAPEDQPTGRLLVATLEQERQTARITMARALASPRYTRLIDALRIAGDAPKFERDPDVRARPVLAKLVRRAWARLERSVADLDDDPPDEKLHEVRIRAKRARYAAEAAVPAWGKRARRLAAAAARVQDVLGRFNDAVVADAWLRTVPVRVPEAAFVAGVLSERQRVAAAACRTEFPRVWRKAAKPKLRAWTR